MRFMMIADLVRAILFAADAHGPTLFIHTLVA